MLFDIEQIAQPLITNLSDLSKTKDLKDNIVDLMFVIERLKSLIPELNREESKKLLDKTKNITRQLVESEEKFSGTNAEITDDFNQLMKALSKLRLALHNAYTKGVPVKPTSADFKEAISSTSLSSVLHTLANK